MSTRSQINLLTHTFEAGHTIESGGNRITDRDPDRGQSWGRKPKIVRRDENYIAIEEDYKSLFIPEHCIDHNRWPKNYSSAKQGGASIKTVYVFYNDKLFRCKSVALAVMHHGNWVARRLVGGSHNLPHQWAMYEEDFERTYIVDESIVDYHPNA